MIRILSDSAGSYFFSEDLVGGNVTEKTKANTGKPK